MKQEVEEVNVVEEVEEGEKMEATLRHTLDNWGVANLNFCEVNLNEWWCRHNLKV